MANPNSPFHPIIYVRGFAMTPNEIDASQLARRRPINKN